MAEQTIQVDGIAYHALLEGPQDKPLVLLVHALMSTLHMWDATVLALHTAGYRTLRFDHIGHNLTSPPQDSTRSYSTDDITRHMREIVHQTTGQSKIKGVFGCSIGGVLALRYAMLYEADVEVAISLCAPGMTSLEAAKPLWSQRIEQFEKDERNGTRKLHQATVDRWIPDDEAHDEAVRKEAYQHVTTCGLQGYKILADAIRNYDYDDQLQDLQGVKCLIIAGGRDGAVDRRVLEKVAANIPGARFVCLENAGHLPPMHRPEEFQHLMLETLR